MLQKSTVPIEIAGAGPAGLAAALTIVHSGRPARVYEQRHDVGLRFHGDFQGLENWTTPIDVLDELQQLGIATDFEHTPFSEIVAFDPAGQARTFRSRRPLFYLIRRGQDAGSLDRGLKLQALTAGVELRFDTAIQHFPHGGIVTQGPHRADAIAAGYLFDTDMADGAFAAVSDDLAPKGYAYLLVHGGRGTLASCLFADFHHERDYVERCVAFFTDKVGVRMRNARRFGGSGNFALPSQARKGNILYAGESAGFQDPLFGFGMRAAIITGALAGAALAAEKPGRYEREWKHRLRDYQQAAATNRWFYERLGDRGYQKVLRGFPEQADVRDWLRRAYAPRLWKRAWYYIVRQRFNPVLAIHADCDCTWCRCARHEQASV